MTWYYTYILRLLVKPTIVITNKALYFSLLWYPPLFVCLESKEGFSGKAFNNWLTKAGISVKHGFSDYYLVCWHIEEISNKIDIVSLSNVLRMYCLSSCIEIIFYSLSIPTMVTLNSYTFIFFLVSDATLSWIPCINENFMLLLLQYNFCTLGQPCIIRYITVPETPAFRAIKPHLKTVLRISAPSVTVLFNNIWKVCIGLVHPMHNF